MKVVLFPSFCRPVDSVVSSFCHSPSCLSTIVDFRWGDIKSPSPYYVVRHVMLHSHVACLGSHS